MGLEGGGGGRHYKYLFQVFFPFTVVASLNYFSLRTERDNLIFFPEGCKQGVKTNLKKEGVEWPGGSEQI